MPKKCVVKEISAPKRRQRDVHVGVKQITSELTFIVDSDDKLVPDAIEMILQYHKKYKERKDLCGYSFLRRFPDGNINGKPFESDEKVGTYIECRINADDTQADKAEVFYTRCLKEFPFPEYRNEKFLGEDLVWIRMAMKSLCIQWIYFLHN